MKPQIAFRIVLAICFTAQIFATQSITAQTRQRMPLNEGWRFFFKSENSSDNARYVTLPHTWNTDARAAGYMLETTANYQNDIYIPQEWASRRLFVKFYGAQSVADVFVNGQMVGTHRGGSTAFTFEITNKVRFGGDNTLTVVVSNAMRSDVLPASTDINLYGGLYREAELILTDKTAVSPLHLGTEGVLVRQGTVTTEKAEGEVEVHLTAAGESGCVLTLEIAAPDGKTVFTKRQKVRIDSNPILIPFAIEKPQLWSPASPVLYTVTATIGEQRASDRVSVSTGLRSITATPAGGLCINGTKVAVHGVTLYHDNLRSSGALTAADYDDDLRQIRALGATAIRSAVMPHAQHLYDRCDAEGLLVWVDAPLQRAPFLGDVGYYASPEAEQNGIRQLQEIIAQNINHPSVVMWGIFSRLTTRGDDVVPYVRKFNELARTMDPSRQTVACSDQDGNINFVTGLIAWGQDVGWSRGAASDVAIWSEKLRRNWPQLRSAICYGGPGFVGHIGNTAQTPADANWMPEQKQTRFHEEYARNLHADSLFWGVWIDNMFDYGSARRAYGVDGAGLVTIDRLTRKDAYYLYKALWNKTEPTLHITEKRLTRRDGEQQVLRVYSSAGSPTLLVGTDTVRMNEYAACQYHSDTVSIRGVATVRAWAGDLRDSVTIRADNSPKQRRRQVLR